MGFEFESWFWLSGLLPSVGTVVLVFVAVLLATSARDAPDPNHQRPAALYFAGVRFVTLFVALIAGFFAISSLLKAPIDNNQGGWFGFAPNTGQAFLPPDVGDIPEPLPNDRIPSDVLLGANEERDRDLEDFLQGLAVALLAIGVFLFHERRHVPLAVDMVEGDAAWRIEQGYRRSVAFVAILIFLAAGGAALFGLIDAIAPGLDDSGPRSTGVVRFLSAGLFAGAAGFLAWGHIAERSRPDFEIDDDASDDDASDDDLDIE